jgi:hypothetical protein
MQIVCFLIALFPSMKQNQLVEFVNDSLTVRIRIPQLSGGYFSLSMKVTVDIEKRPNNKQRCIAMVLIVPSVFFDQSAGQL